jgi:hypothetical protein
MKRSRVTASDRAEVEAFRAWLGQLASLRCACGSDQPMCFDPGSVEVREHDILLKREQLVVGRCLPCVVRRWSSPVAHLAHNQKVGGSNPPPAIPAEATP